MLVKNNYALVLLLAASTLNFLDHQILALLIEPIKDEMLLSDVQLGLLSGIAFALFYCVMGIPIARWADRGNRVNIIALSVTLFSFMTALFGLANNFFQLLLCRIGVGVGEAGCTPPSHSLIADYFTRKERPLAMAIYMMGAPLGVVLGFFLAGWINEFYGWRMAFLVLGVPGVLLGLLIKYMMQETRGEIFFRAASSKGEHSHQVSFITLFFKLWRQNSYRHLLVALSTSYCVGYGLSQWVPAFFMRTHGLTTGNLGNWLSMISLLAAIGTWLGGYLASRYLAHNEKVQLRIVALIMIVNMVASAFVFMLPSYFSSLLVYIIPNVLGLMTLGPVYSVVQSLVGDGERAMAVAILYLVINLTGMGIGPLAVGLLSDYVFSGFGEQSLQFSLLAMLPLSFVSAAYFWLSSNSVSADINTVVQSD